MNERYGDVWVCTDCYFAHHYGAHQHEEIVSLWNGDEEDWIDTICYLWYAGEDDEPVGGWYEIKTNHSLAHNLEPLGKLEGFEVADNTCSNHYYGQGDGEHECPICDGGVVAWASFQHPVLCWVCDASGTIKEPCQHCGRDDDETGITDFTWSSCDGCGSHLGGSRYRLSLWKREEVSA